jgi:hypothetical protein
MSKMCSNFPHALIGCDELVLWENALSTVIIEELNKLSSDMIFRHDNIKHSCHVLLSLGTQPEEIIKLLVK